MITVFVGFGEILDFGKKSKYYKHKEQALGDEKMAIAKAQCKCATCGNDFEVRVSRANRRDADSFEKWAAENITECDECKAARIKAGYDEENARSAQAAQEMRYPSLTGTEKQVAWANTIRERTMSTLREYYLDPEKIKRHPQSPRIFDGLSKIMLGHVFAGWWIENQHIAEDLRGIIRTVKVQDKAAYDALEAEITGKPVEQVAASEQPAKPEEKIPVVRPEAKPEKQRHDGAADIKICGSMVMAIYAKDEDFREIVKRMGLTWKDGCWCIEENERHGKTDNISAELGNRLLNAGFAVRFDSQELMERAVNGDYTPMCHRWILNNTQGFYISWSREDDLYKAAKSLPGAKYDSPGMIVPERSWNAVMDFAKKYSYRLTEKAQEKMDRLSEAARVVAPAPVKKPE